METSIKDSNGRRIISLAGRFDAAGAQNAADALEQALAAGVRFVELDMGGVNYLSSAGIRILLTYYKKLTQLKGVLDLTNVQERVSHILEINGLYDLLDPAHASQKSSGSSAQHSLSFDGWSLECFELEAGASLVSRFIGRPCSGELRSVEHSVGNEDSSHVIAFPPTSFSIGAGALGYDAAECAGCSGVFLAAGGFAAFKPAGSKNPPDFVAYAEAYIPELHALGAAAFDGVFSHLVSFDSTGQSPGLTELAQAVRTFAPTSCGMPGVNLLGVVIAAECEVPEINGPAPRIVLAAGVLGEANAETSVLPWLTLWDAKTNLAGHLHAAFFPYQPLRLGHVKLKDALSSLFDSGLLDLVHLDPPAQTGFTGNLKMLRGLIWFSPVRFAER